MGGRALTKNPACDNQPVALADAGIFDVDVAA